MSDAIAIQFEPPLSPEDQARANLYGLLARLFYAPPDAAFLAALAGMEVTEAGPEDRTAQGREMVAAWRELQAASREAQPAALEDEHLALFVGIGKAEVTPYLGAYLQRFEGDSPLARLRGQLAQWGIERRAGTAEPEDHLSGACETMRWLIERRRAPLQTQRECFNTYLYPGGMAFCTAVSDCPGAKFYVPCARLLRAFLEVERQAFEID